MLRPGVGDNGRLALRPGVGDNGGHALRPGVGDNGGLALRPGVGDNRELVLQPGAAQRTEATEWRRGRGAAKTHRPRFPLPSPLAVLRPLLKVSRRAAAARFHRAVARLLWLAPEEFVARISEQFFNSSVIVC